MKRFSFRNLLVLLALLALLQVGLFVIHSRSESPRISSFPSAKKEEVSKEKALVDIKKKERDFSTHYSFYRIRDRYRPAHNASSGKETIFSSSSRLNGVPSGSGTGHNLHHSSVEPKTKRSSLDLLFFGDMMLDRHVGERIQNKGVEYIFQELAGEEERFFQGMDIIGANLEGAVTDRGDHYPPSQAYDFAFSPEIIKTIRDDYNFNFFNIANNHLADQGERGIRETRENLSRLGMDFVGCRDGAAGECSLEFLDVQGKRIAFLGFSMVYNSPSEEKMSDLVDKAASSSDSVIVNVHWGTEYEHRFDSRQQELAHGFIDKGADIIIGHHPHVVQGMEVYKNSPVFYSLGNFVFDQYFSRETQEGLGVGIHLGEEKDSFSLFPLTSEMSQVELMTDPEEYSRFLKEFAEWSELNEARSEQIRESGVLELPHTE